MYHRLLKCYENTSYGDDYYYHLWQSALATWAQKNKIQILLDLVATGLKTYSSLRKSSPQGIWMFKMESDRATLGHNDISFILDFCLSGI
jgi:hypothetical protein